MKKIIILALAGTLTAAAHAQFFDRLKDKMQKKVNDAIDNTIDNAGKKKKKDNSTPATDSNTNKNNSNPAAGNTTVTVGADVAAGTPAAVNTDITSYSKFDFVPGAKIIMQEDFSQDAVGDFPAKWNTRTGAEVVTVNNRPGKWLSIKQDGVFYPEYLNSNLPDNFTLQVDLMASNGIAGIGSITIGLLQTQNDNEKFDMHSISDNAASFKLILAPRSSGDGELHYSSNLIGSQYRSSLPEFNVPKKNTVTVSIWRQKQRVRVYFDSTKALDLPRALDANALINSLLFASYAPDYDKKGGVFYIGNIRLAVGAPDTRNKLITEGKFVTHGILFDVNSDKIQAASYGSLQDIANVLKENATVHVKIVGHTDADGDDQLNLDLSKRRAESVKTALAQTFGIDAARMETDGKGKTQPIDSNTTTAGKANNRRVEFIKL